MSNRVRIVILDSTGASEITYLSDHGANPGSITDPITLTAVNIEEAINGSAVKVFAVRGDMIESEIIDEDVESAQMCGSEAVSEKWLEARLDELSPWVALDPWDCGGLELGDIPAGGTKTFQVRFNIPASAESIGEVNLNLRIDSSR